jgi:hypothetical protein
MASKGKEMQGMQRKGMTWHGMLGKQKEWKGNTWHGMEC